MKLLLVGCSLLGTPNTKKEQSQRAVEICRKLVAADANLTPALSLLAELLTPDSPEEAITVRKREVVHLSLVLSTNEYNPPQKKTRPFPIVKGVGDIGEESRSHSRNLLAGLFGQAQSESKRKCVRRSCCKVSRSLCAQRVVITSLSTPRTHTNGMAHNKHT